MCECVEERGLGWEVRCVREREGARMARGVGIESNRIESNRCFRLRSPAQTSTARPEARGASPRCGRAAQVTPALTARLAARLLEVMRTNSVELIDAMVSLRSTEEATTDQLKAAFEHIAVQGCRNLVGKRVRLVHLTGEGVESNGCMGAEGGNVEPNPKPNPNP